ncbi:hypothetical protein RRG08_007786 [Elysia crispata]|uniref:Uncharacterized protein n=1 Tax=Elysia crispata TaxID=231223 RepID=A0AAE1B261_9GAST|nr:hypothetical protein RRG08_007786 [Elysia crispata]
MLANQRIEISIGKTQACDVNKLQQVGLAVDVFCGSRLYLQKRKVIELGFLKSQLIVLRILNKKTIMAIVFHSQRRMRLRPDHHGESPICKNSLTASLVGFGNDVNTTARNLILG